MTASRRPTRPLALLPLISALCSAAFGAAHASTIQVQTGLSPAQLLQPTEARLQAACDAGMQLATAGGNAAQLLGNEVMTLRLPGDATHTLSVQTAPGSALNACRNTAMNANAFTQGQALMDNAAIWVQVNGDMESGPQLQGGGWGVTLSVLDKGGHELARLRPSMTVQGSPGDWTAWCQETACGWRGQQVYGFALGALSAAEVQAVAAGERVVVLVELPAEMNLAPVAWLMDRTHAHV